MFEDTKNIPIVNGYDDKLDTESLYDAAAPVISTLYNLDWNTCTIRITPLPQYQSPYCCLSSKIQRTFPAMDTDTMAKRQHDKTFQRTFPAMDTNTMAKRQNSNTFQRTSSSFLFLSSSLNAPILLIIVLTQVRLTMIFFFRRSFFVVLNEVIIILKQGRYP